MELSHKILPEQVVGVAGKEGEVQFSSSDPSLQSSSKSHFQCADMQCPFLHVNCPFSQLA